MRILPISLFTEKGSSGMGSALDAGPEYVELRRLISTSADMFLVNTLPHDVSTLIPNIDMPDIPWLVLDHAAIRAIQHRDEARYRSRHVSRMMEELDLRAIVSPGLRGCRSMHIPMCLRLWESGCRTL